MCSSIEVKLSGYLLIQQCYSATVIVENALTDEEAIELAKLQAHNGAVDWRPDSIAEAYPSHAEFVEATLTPDPATIVGEVVSSEFESD